MNKWLIGGVGLVVVAGVALAVTQLSQPSQAERGKARADVFLAAMKQEEPDLTVTYESAATDDSTGSVVLSNVTIAKAGEDETITVANVVLGNYADEQAWPSSVEATGIAAAAEDVGVTAGAMRLEDWADADSAPRRIRIEDVELATDDAGTIRVARIDVKELDTEHDVPHFVDMEVTGVEIPMDGADAEMRQSLTDLGYEKVILDIVYKVNYEEAAQQLNVSDLSIVLRDMGSVAFNMRAENIPSSAMDEPLMMLMGLNDIRIGPGRMTYTESSLFNRIVESEAKKENVDIDTMRDNMVATLEAIGQDSSVPLQGEMLEALKSFVRDPQSIAIVVDPPSPVTVGELQALENDPASLLQRLGLTVVANQ